MTLSELKKNIKGVFKFPKKVYYLGKLIHGAPYFYPMSFEKYGLFVRRLIPKTKDQLSEMELKFPHLKRDKLSYYSNAPMVRRSKHWLVKIFNQAYYVAIGWPVYIYWHGLGWKDKFESPRFEWTPGFYIFFFRWQFCIWWVAPDGDNDRYYEMILRYLFYNNRDLDKVEKNWGWKIKVGDEWISTWTKDYLV